MKVMIRLLIVGIWLGLVLGISFMEAPLKFQAPDITLALGLGIGRLVFGALNKIEIVFSFLLIALHWNDFKALNKLHLGSLITLFIIVAIQSVYLLPVLDERAGVIISGQEPPASAHHLWYILIEIVKVLSLFTLFYQLFKFSSLNNSNKKQ
ncbi:MAG: hypothetical protein AB8F74_14725 [Saprospiraceae bacterium]